MHQCYLCGQWRVSQALIKESADAYFCRAATPCLEARKTRTWDES
jgi:hypothetical protein